MHRTNKFSMTKSKTPILVDDSSHDVTQQSHFADDADVTVILTVIPRCNSMNQLLLFTKIDN